MSHMMKHLEDEGILDPNQHGFRKGLSTETQLIQAVHDWADCLNRRGQTDVLFLDFSKAFDTVPHVRLLGKLRYYGITGKANNWISSLLSGRRQRVVVNGSGSDWSPVLSGVPQGTVIGPILFLIYINDISHGISSQMRLFADDSIIYRQISSADDHLKLQQDVTLLQEWSTKWQMSFKPEKCFVMSITNKRYLSTYDYALGGTTLARVTSWTYLGVVIDSKLNWNCPCDSGCAKARHVPGFIQHTLHGPAQI